MDREVIEQKLESLRRFVLRVRERCPADLPALLADPDAQDVVVLNLTRAVQLCVDIGAHIASERGAPAPDTMGQVFDSLAATGAISQELALRMKKSVGFRNVAIHNYRAIDWHVVHGIVREHLGDFEMFARVVAGLGKLV